MAVMRQQTQVFNKPIGVVRADAGGARVGEAIASAADTMARITFEKAAKEAEKRGIDAAKAVEDSGLKTIDPTTGKPEAFKAPTGFGSIAAEAYQRVVDARFEDSVNTELRLKAQEIALKYEYDADGYSEVFSDYIENMSKNAEGHYKTFIETNGATYLASTALNIKEKAIARSRARLGQSALDTSNKNQSKAYETSKAGGYMPDAQTQMSETDELAARDNDLIKSGVDSNLLKPGADTVSAVAMNTSIAQGAVEHIAKLTANSSERNLVTLAIRRGTTEGLGISPGLEANVTALLRYVSPDNRADVLRHHDAVSSDYNAVEADMIAESKANAAASQLQFSVFADQAADRLSVGAMGSAYSAFQDDDTNINGRMAIPGAVANSSDQYTQLESQLGSRVGPGYTLEAYKGDTRDARQALLKPYLLNAAAQGEGSVEDLRLALTSQNQRAFNALDSKQQQLVVELRSSSFFDLSKETTDFVSSTLNGIVDKEAETQAQIQQNISLMDSFNASLEMASNGSLREEDYNKRVQEMRSNIKPNGFTLSQVDGFTSELDRARASSLITEFAAVSPKMNSYSLNMLQQYVNLKGQGDAANFPSNVKQFGDYILDVVSKPEDLKSVSQEINSLEATYAAREEDERKQREAAAEVARLGFGNGNALIAKDRKGMDEVLTRLELNPAMFNQMEAKDKSTLLALMRSTPAQAGLIEPLERLSAGLQVNNPESFIQLFGLLSRDIDPKNGAGVVNDRFGSGTGAPLNDVQKERLRDIYTIYTVEGGDINEIAMRLSQMADSPQSKDKVLTFLENSNSSNMKEYLGALSSISGNSRVVNEMVPVAEYLIGTGVSIDKVEERINEIIETNYPEAEYIVDPDSPSPMLNRSRFALTKTIPDQEVRNVFLGRVNTLVSGLSIGDKKLHLGSVSVSSTGFRESVALEDQVFLRPDPSGASDRYFLYYMDNNELKPLIYSADNEGNQMEEGGQNFWPSFSVQSEVGEMLRIKTQQELLELMSDVDKQEAVQQMIFDLKDIPPADRIEFIRRRRLQFDAQQEGSM